jgi:hypothetical protein
MKLTTTTHVDPDRSLRPSYWEPFVAASGEKQMAIDRCRWCARPSARREPISAGLEVAGRKCGHSGAAHPRRDLLAPSCERHARRSASPTPGRPLLEAVAGAEEEWRVALVHDGVAHSDPGFAIVVSRSSRTPGRATVCSPISVPKAASLASPLSPPGQPDHPLLLRAARGLQGEVWADRSRAGQMAQLS